MYGIFISGPDLIVDAEADLRSQTPQYPNELVARGGKLAGQTRCLAEHLTTLLGIHQPGRPEGGMQGGELQGGGLQAI